MKNMKKFLVGALMLITAGCTSPADVVSHNISKAADNFKVQRRIVFYNGITGGYMLSVEGLCSLGNYDEAGELTVTCRVGPNKYKKHFLGLSDNVTYFVEQTDAVNVSKYHYKVYFNPNRKRPRGWHRNYRSQTRFRRAIESLPRVDVDVKEWGEPVELHRKTQRPKKRSA